MELKDRLNKLNQEYILVFEKREDLLKKHRSALEAIYLSYFGGLIYKKFELELQYRKLKAKINKMIAAINCGQKVEIDKIENELTKELENFYKEINDFKKKLKESKDYITSPIVTDEELKEIKLIFRTLAKKLHPDIVGDLDEIDQNLWYQVLEAYENNDLLSLIVLNDTIDNNIKKDDKVDYNNLENRINRIEKEIEIIKQDINNAKKEFPFNIEDKMNDPKFVEDKKKQLVQEINTLRSTIEKLNNNVNELLGGQTVGK